MRSLAHNIVTEKKKTLLQSNLSLRASLSVLDNSLGSKDTKIHTSSTDLQRTGTYQPIRHI